MLIREILSLKSADIHSIGAVEPVRDAIAKMVGLGIGSLVAMTDGEMVGLITERDIVQGMQKYGCDLKEQTVASVMTADPVAASVDDTLDYARDVMTKSHVGHLVVLDGDKLYGVMSFHDVARASLHEATFENSLLKRYIKHWPE